MVNTYNESSLHKEIKSIFAQKYSGKTEQKCGNYIADILLPDNSIIEIQNGNFSKLLGKLITLLPSHKIKVVYPLDCTRYIENRDESGTLISRRKSPKKKNIYWIFNELMHIYPFLLENNFSLEVLLTTQVEKRLVTAEPVQLPNKSRRFKRNWIKKDKVLEEILGAKTFNSIQDYIDLIAINIDKTNFSAPELAKTTGKQNAYKIIWMFKKLDLIELIGKEGNTKKYRLINNEEI